MSPEAHIAHISAHFTAGRYDLLTGIYCFPLPVYLDGVPSVLGTRRDMGVFFQSLHSRLISAGLPRLDGQMTSVEPPKSDRFRIWAEWTGVGAEGRQPVMSTICYNRGSHASHLTEMLQITLEAEMPLAALLRAA